MKRFNVMFNVGKAKYVVNHHNGESKHPDGSDFVDVAIFHSRRAIEKFIGDLKAKGYTEDGITPPKPKPKPPMTPKKYASMSGSVCPSCRSDNIQSDSIEGLDLGMAMATVRCSNCGAKWDDQYNLIGYDNLR